MLSRVATFFGLASAAFAGDIWFVDDSAPGRGSGTLLDPYKSLQYAISQPATKSGDEILVLPGTYFEVIDLSGKSLRITGVAGAQATVVDGQGQGSVFTVASGEGPGTVLKGLTVRRGVGRIDGFYLVGGGVFASGVELDLVDCVLEDHLACDRGGAIWARNSVLDLSGCELRDNVEGGALHAELSAVTVFDCRIERNQRLGFFDVGSGLHLEHCSTTVAASVIRANGNPLGEFDMGGGVHATGGSLAILDSSFEANRNEWRGGALDLTAVTATLSGCTFEDNESADLYAGGAIFVSATGGASDLAIYDCLFSSNWAGDGGALWLGSGQAQVVGCTFLDNVATAYPFYSETGRGGAIWVGGASASFERCVFQGNRSLGNDDDAGAQGGAAYGSAQFDRCTFVENVAASSPSAPSGGALFGGTLKNGIAWENVPESLAGPVSASFSAIEGGFLGVGNTASDPHLWSIAERDWGLLPESVAIDSGDPTTPFDPDGSRADMGAIPYDRTHCGARCTGPIGTPFCFAMPNSSGASAVLSALGSPAIADDRVLFFVDQAPSGKSALLLLSNVAFPRPHDLVQKSRTCVGLPKVLRSVEIDAAGRVDVDAAFVTWPAGQIVFPGETWFFQLTFLDADPGPVRNTSSALRVTFQ